MTWKILQASLVPSQVYQVKVRSFVVPGDKSIYGGIPSEWSGPAIWTSHEGSVTPNPICPDLADVIYCVYSEVNNIIYSVLPAPAATWSPSTLIYFFISMFAATFFFILYCAVTACQRSVLDAFLTWTLWPFCQ